MQTRLHILPILLLCLASPAMAEDWSSIVNNNDYEVLVDIDSFNVEGNTPYITAKTMFKSSQIHSLNKKKIQYVTSIKNMLFNCAEPVYKTISIALYDKKNKLLVLEKKASAFKKIGVNTQEFLIGQLTCQVHQMLGG